MSTSHRTAEATVNTCPSRQYVGEPSNRQATDAVSPFVDRRAAEPRLASRKAPVPYVHLASPGRRQPSPSSAACWSTSSPVSGTRGPNASVAPNDPLASTTSGRSSSPSPNAAHASADQRHASRSRSIVREAVDASVTKAPVRACTSHASEVVTTPSRVRFSRSQAIFGAAKYGSRASPVRSASRCAVPSTAAIRRHTASDRRSCHPIASVSGSPVDRSQASTVSPWLASPTAATGTPACSTARRPASTTEASSSAGSCSTSPSAP